MAPVVPHLNTPSKEEAVAATTTVHSRVMVFSDGSGHDRHIGAATVLYRDSEEKSTLTKYMGTAVQHTVYKAELLGLALVAKLISTELHVPYAMIGADSQVAIWAVGHSRGTLGHYLTDVFQEQMTVACSKHTGMLELRWMLGHTGIVGNE